MPPKHWLMKAEPNSRIEKGKDVKFSVDDFEAVQTTPWEGVRNHEAKKLMQSMKVGDKVLFYHSNCKVPGVAAFAEVAKEAYPDYTAWDPAHPYYDAKSDKTAPRWFMVDVTFKARCAHFVPLALFKRLAALDSPTESDLPPDVAYIGEAGVRAIKGMALVNRGRLSVQPVEEDAWAAVQLLAGRGGWDEEAPGTGAKSRKNAKKGGAAKSAPSEELESEPELEHEAGESKTEGKAKGKAGAKASRSTRTRTTKAKAGTDVDVDADADAGEEPGSEKNNTGGAAPSPSGETHVDSKGDKKSTRKRKASTLGGDERKSGEAQEGRAPRRSTRARK